VVEELRGDGKLITRGIGGVSSSCSMSKYNLRELRDLLVLVAVVRRNESLLSTGEQPSSLQLVTAAAIVRMGQATSGASSRPIMTLQFSMLRFGVCERSGKQQNGVPPIEMTF
jgi:hypothetical protein